MSSVVAENLPLSRPELIRFCQRHQIRRLSFFASVVRDDFRPESAVYVGHMVDVARQIDAKLSGKDRSGFDADENLRLAITHLIQTVGEASRVVTETTKEANSQFPWRKISGMRPRIVQDDLNVDFDIVWEVASREMTQPIAQIEAVLHEMDETP